MNARITKLTAGGDETAVREHRDPGLAQGGQRHGVRRREHCPGPRTGWRNRVLPKNQAFTTGMDQVGDDGVDDLTERATDDHADGQVDTLPLTANSWNSDRRAHGFTLSLVLSTRCRGTARSILVSRGTWRDCSSSWP